MMAQRRQQGGRQLGYRFCCSMYNAEVAPLASVVAYRRGKVNGAHLQASVEHRPRGSARHIMDNDNVTRMANTTTARRRR